MIRRAVEALSIVGETWLHQISDMPLFGDLPESPRPEVEAQPGKPKFRAYPLRQDLALPAALIRELPPDRAG